MTLEDVYDEIAQAFEEARASGVLEDGGSCLDVYKRQILGSLPVFLRAESRDSHAKAHANDD